MSEKIIKLTKLWYQIVGTDHHKDRDCHWYINTVYSYGMPPRYRIEHYGYIYKDIGEELDTYNAAEYRLVEIIKEAIRAERDWAKAVVAEPHTYDTDQEERAKKILELINENN